MMGRRHQHRPMIPPPKPPRTMISPATVLAAAEQLHREGNLYAAIRGYYGIMAGLGKGHAIAHRAMFLTALACFQMRIYGEAVLLMEEFTRCEWNNPDGHYNLGLFKHALGDPAGAADCYRTALAIKPEYAAAENNLGNALRELGDTETATLCYDRLMARNPTDPEASYNLAHVLLLRGDLRNGFQRYEDRWRCAGWNAEYGRRDITSPRLAPAASPQHVLVHQEQGIGDTLQFLRYLPKLTECGHRVTFEAPRELYPWITNLQLDGVTFLQRGDPLPEHDAHVPLLSLPAYFQLEHEADIPPIVRIPTHVPSVAARVTDRMDRRPLIGIAWAGNPRHHNDRHRSAPLAQLAPLFARPGTRFVSLQIGERGVELLSALPNLPLGARSEILEVSAQLRTLEHTAALASFCSAIVTVDTSIAHLGGMYGTPTLILTSWLSEWRWQLDRTDSPWYPSVELIRQPRLGDWTATAEAARRRLSQILTAPLIEAL